MAQAQFELSSPPTDGITAIKFAPKNSNKLVVSSWDKNVYLYEINGSAGDLVRQFEFDAGVLDVCFGQDEDEIFVGGLDWDVRRVDVRTGEQTVISEHDQPVKSVLYSTSSPLLISASWDSSLHIHTMKDGAPVSVAAIQLPSKPYSLSISPTKLVVAMANRAVNIYDLQTLSDLCEQAPHARPQVVDTTPWQERESSMKFQIRAVACMPNDNGYASSSIEGRVAVEWFDPSESSQSRKYAFKCHRQVIDGEDLVYPVHALAFHPIHGTFASGGGDGVVALWDGVAKRRIRQYQKYSQSVAALDFSPDGNLLAVGISPGIEDDTDIDGLDYEGKIKIYVRELGEDEAKTKSKK